MKVSRKLKIWFISLFIIVFGFYCFIQYDYRHLLTSGILKINEKPPTLDILKIESFGLTDSRMEYYLSINKNDFPQLLAGRNYNLRPDAKKIFFRLGSRYTAV